MDGGNFECAYCSMKGLWNIRAGTRNEHSLYIGLVGYRIELYINLHEWNVWGNATY